MAIKYACKYFKSFKVLTCTYKMFPLSIFQVVFPKYDLMNFYHSDLQTNVYY